MNTEYNHAQRARMNALFYRALDKKRAEARAPALRRAYVYRTDLEAEFPELDEEQVTKLALEEYTLHWQPDDGPMFSASGRLEGIFFAEPAS